MSNLMLNTQSISDSFVGSQRATLPTVRALALIVSLYGFGAAFFNAHGQIYVPPPNFTIERQRCGDRIYFSFIDRAGKNVDPANFNSVVINGVARTPLQTIEKNKMKGFEMPTGCGVGMMKVEVIYRNKKNGVDS